MVMGGEDVCVWGGEQLPHEQRTITRNVERHLVRLRLLPVSV